MKLTKLPTSPIEEIMQSGDAQVCPFYLAVSTNGFES